MTLVTTMSFDRFLCYFCSAVQLHTSTVVDSAVLGSDMVVEPFVGRETAGIRVRPLKSRVPKHSKQTCRSFTNQ